MRDNPDFQDAQLTMQLYDLRREPVIRDSRSALFMRFNPKKYEDVIEITTQFDHPLNMPFRQVSGYWEMVYGMARHGIAHPGYLIENHGEGLFLYGKMFPFLEQYRKDNSPTAFQNAEWITTQTEPGRKRFEMIQARIKKMMESK